MASGSAAGSASAPATSSASGASGSGTSASFAVIVTFVPHPDGSSATVPHARSPSQATVVSGSRRVMRISPNSPKWRARASTSETSAHSSGGLLTRVLCARGSCIASVFRHPRGATLPAGARLRHLQAGARVLLEEDRSSSIGTIDSVM